MMLADELAELHERHMNSTNHIEVRGYAIFALKEKLICNLPEIIAALRAKDDDRIFTLSPALKGPDA